jgi:hypothetical protein
MSNTLGSIVSLLKISCVELLVVIVSLGNVDGSFLSFLGEEFLIDLWTQFELSITKCLSWK